MRTTIIPDTSDLLYLVVSAIVNNGISINTTQALNLHKQIFCYVTKPCSGNGETIIVSSWPCIAHLDYWCSDGVLYVLNLLDQTPKKIKPHHE